MKLLIMHVERGVLDSWKPECRATASGSVSQFRHVVSARRPVRLCVYVGIFTNTFSHLSFLVSPRSSRDEEQPAGGSFI